MQLPSAMSLKRYFVCIFSLDVEENEIYQVVILVIKYRGREASNHIFGNAEKSTRTSRRLFYSTPQLVYCCCERFAPIGSYSIGYALEWSVHQVSPQIHQNSKLLLLRHQSQVTNRMHCVHTFVAEKVATVAPLSQSKLANDCSHAPSAGNSPSSLILHTPDSWVEKVGKRVYEKQTSCAEHADFSSSLHTLHLPYPVPSVQLHTRK